MIKGTFFKNITIVLLYASNNRTSKNETKDKNKR